MVKKFLPVIVCLAFAVFAGFPLLHSGLIPTHDGEYHVVRFYEFDKTLRAGSLYPRWASDLNNGFGVPLFNYVYPLPNYIASFFHFLGTSFIDAFKLQMFFALLVGSVFFYLLSKEFFGEVGGVVSSVFYTFAPYHFVDIYVRGSVGEVWALSLFPGFLWFLTKTVKSKKERYAFCSSILLTLIIFSHNILALMFVLFAFLYGIILVYLQKDKSLVPKIIAVFLLGVGIASIFWVPALFEKQYVKGLEVFDIKSNFPEIYQLIFPSWGNGLSGDLQSGLSVQVGPMHLLSVFLAIAAIFFVYRKENNRKIILSFFVICFFIILFFMNRASLSIWQKIPLFNYFQFPWRFLSLEILVASFCAGSLFSFKKGNYLAATFIILVYLLGISYTKPAYYMYRDDSYYTSRPNFISGTNSPGNVFNTIWIDRVPNKIGQKIVKEYNFEVNSKYGSEMSANIAYFPGWKVYIDNLIVTDSPSSSGSISFFEPKGFHKVKIIFEDTGVRTLGLIISTVSFIILLFLLKKESFATMRG